MIQLVQNQHTEFVIIASANLMLFFKYMIAVQSAKYVLQYLSLCRANVPLSAAWPDIPIGISIYLEQDLIHYTSEFSSKNLWAWIPSLCRCWITNSYVLRISIELINNTDCGHKVLLSQWILIVDVKLCMRLMRMVCLLPVSLNFQYVSMCMRR